jgi:hypothetical protein
MTRVPKVSHSDLHVIELLSMMSRIVSGEEPSEEKAVRVIQQRINFLEACSRQRGGQPIPLSYAELALAIEYGADATMALHALELKVFGLGEVYTVVNIVEMLIKYGADVNHDVSSMCYSYGPGTHILFSRIQCWKFVIMSTYGLPTSTIALLSLMRKSAKRK